MLLPSVLTGISRADPSLVEFLKSEAGCESSGQHGDGDDGGECEEMEDDEP